MNARQLLLLPLLMIGASLMVGLLYVTLPLIADLAQRWQVTAGQASWAGSAFGFAYAAGFLLLGRLSDRYGRRRVLLSSLAAMALTSVAVAGSVSFTMLLGARALQGLVAAAFPPAALALVAEALPPARRALGISLLSFAFLAAAPLAQFLAAQSAGWGLPVIMAAVAAAGVLLSAALAIVLPPAAPTSVHTAVPPQAATAGPERQSGLVGVWLAALTVLFVFVTFHAGAQAMKLAATDLQILRLAGLPPLLLSIAAARLVRHIGTVATARAGFVIAAAGLLTGAPGHFGGLVAASVLLSAGVALAVPGLIGTLALRTAPAGRARAMSIYTFALFVGASLAPPTAQVLAPLGWLALMLTPAVALSCAVAIVGGLPMLLLHRSSSASEASSP